MLVCSELYIERVCLYVCCVGILLAAVYNKVPNLTPELRLIYYSEHYANVIRCHIFTMYNLHHWLTFFVFLCLFNSFLLANSSIFFLSRLEIFRRWYYPLCANANVYAYRILFQQWINTVISIRIQ